MTSNEKAPLLPLKITLQDVVSDAGEDEELDKPATPEETEKAFFQTLLEILKIFSHATPCDKTFLFLGTFATFVHALCFLALAVILGKLTHPFIQIALSEGHYAPNLMSNNSRLNLTTEFLTRDEFLHTLKGFSVSFYYIAGIVTVSSFFQALLFEWTADNQCYNLRSTYVSQVLRQPLGFFKENSACQLSFVLSDATDEVREGIGYKFSLALQYAAVCGIQVAYALYTQWKLTLIFLSISPVAYLAAKALNLGKLLVHKDESEKKLYADGAAKSNEVTENIRMVLACSKEAYEIDRCRKELRKAAKVANRKHQVEAVGVASFVALLLGSYALAFQHACQLIMNHSNTITEIYTVFLTMTIAVFSLGQIIPWISIISSAYESGLALAGITQLKPPAIDVSQSKPRNYVPVPSGELKLEDVSFAYSPGLPILNGLNLEIKPEQAFIGITGSPNSGKTTIVNLLARFYDPQSGRISMDGRDFKSLDVAWVRSQVTIAPQVPDGFQQVSVVDNICAGAPIPLEDVKRMASIVRIHDDINSLKDGYDTILGISPDQLSTAKQHKIEIVRAAVRDPTWLILDEALDPLRSSEALKILEGLRGFRKHKPTILVTSKVEMLTGADVIHVIQGGKISQSGSYSELMESRGQFYAQATATTPAHSASETLDNYIPLTYDLNLGAKMSKSNQKGQMPRVIEDDHAKMKEIYPGFWRILEITNYSWADWSLWILAVLGAFVASLLIPAFALYYVNIFMTFGEISVGLVDRSRFWTWMLVGFAGVAGISYLVRSLFLHVAGEFMILNLRMLCFMSILARPLSWFDKRENSMAYISARIAEGVPMVKTALDNRFTSAFCGYICMATAFIVCISLCWQISLAALIAVQVIIRLSSLQVHYRRKVLDKGMGLLERASLVFRCAVDCIWSVQAFNSASSVKENYLSLMHVIKKAKHQATRIFAVTFALSEGIVYLILGVIFAYGCYLIETREILPLSFFTVYLVLVFCLTNSSVTTVFVSDFSKAELAFARVIDLVEGGGELETKRLRIGGEMVLCRVAGRIRFDRVTFYYKGNNVAVLRDCSFDLPAGKSLAIVQGKGKTSILNLILRFYEAVDGAVFIDETDVVNLERRALRANIGYVPQEPSLFRRPIYENIVYGCTRKTEDVELAAMVVKVVREINLEKFITSLPKDYNTIVDDSGTFPNIVRMKISIARALIRDPRILLLDEPTEGLMASEETEMLEILQRVKQGRTCIWTTKKKRLTQVADLVGVLSSAQIKNEDFGSNAELAKVPTSLYCKFMKGYN